MPDRIRAQAALACPVISFQTEKRSLIVARYPVAGSRCRRGRKCGEMPLNADRGRWAPPGEWNPRIDRS